MHEPIIQAISAGAVVFACALIQSTAGFGFSLFAVPLLLMFDFSLPEAVALSTMSSALQRTQFAVKLRRHIDWRSLLPLILTAILFLPVGLLLLARVADLPKDTVRQVIGGLILLMVLLKALFKVEPRAKIATGWGILAAGCSGTLNGFANIGGPPLVLWSYAHDWPNERMRASPMAISLPLVPIQFGMLFWRFGNPILSALGLGLLLAPLVLLGGRIGIALGGRLPVLKLRRLVTVMLILMALSYILKPIFLTTD